MTIPKKTQLQNVEVNLTYASGNYSLSCEYDGARYHVWVDRGTHGIVIENILYKNPPLGVKYGDKEAGYFSTRSLDSRKTFGVALINGMFAVANAQKLFQAAEDRLSQQAQQEQEEAQERKRLNTIREAAPELLEACRSAREALNHHGIVGDPASFLLDSAIDKAEGNANAS